MSTLNLTRKFRINTFEEVVGQQLIVRMLKNSLYSSRFFPVYLFFGQHGCGKTSIARIFGMSINCQALSAFRTAPKLQSIPCLTCHSCIAMQTNSHLDFIEIDAASYTGVDNIRNIIESASYLPVIGSKKIYLIDEAHMLSKAAFNALLKILEEPPANVLFMLATTDVEKIIETVKSRCFQLFFQPISSEDIVKHLTCIVTSEHINYDADALYVIAGHANGSVRDALNLIERIRSAYPKITLDAVDQVLGKISDQTMEQFITALQAKDTTLVLEFLASKQFINATPTVLWRHVFQLLRSIWYAKQGVNLDTEITKTVVETLSKTCSFEFISYVLSFLYMYELHFLKTHSPRFFMEHMFTLIVCRTDDAIKHVHAPAPQQLQKKHFLPLNSNQPIANSNATPITQTMPDVVQKKNSSDQATIIKHFIDTIKAVVTPMIHALFSQALYTIQKKEVIIALPQSASFLQNVLQEAEVSWLPIFKDIFGHDTIHIYQFIEPKKSINTPIEPTPSSLSSNTDNKQLIPKAPLSQEKKITPTTTQQKKTITDVSDISRWPQVHLILKYFPGTVTFIEQ